MGHVRTRGALKLFFVMTLGWLIDPIVLRLTVGCFQTTIRLVVICFAGWLVIRLEISIGLTELGKCGGSHLHGKQAGSRHLGKLARSAAIVG